MVELLRDMQVLSDYSAAEALQCAVCDGLREVAVKLLELAVDPMRATVSTLDLYMEEMLPNGFTRRARLVTGAILPVYKMRVPIYEWAVIVADKCGVWFARMLAERGVPTGASTDEDLYLFQRALQLGDVDLLTCIVEHAAAPRADLANTVAMYGTAPMMDVLLEHQIPIESSNSFFDVLENAMKHANKETTMWLIKHNYTDLFTPKYAFQELIDKQKWAMFDVLSLHDLGGLAMDDYYSTEQLGFVVFCLGLEGTVHFKRNTPADMLTMHLRRDLMLERGLQGAAALAFVRSLLARSCTVRDVFLQKLGETSGRCVGIEWLDQLASAICMEEATPMTRGVVTNILHILHRTIHQIWHVRAH